MRGGRLGKLARVLVDHALEAKEGEEVLICSPPAAEPLVQEAYVRLLQVGATPVPQIVLPGLEGLFFEHARWLHYEKTPSILRRTFEEANAVVNIAAPTNTRALATVDPEKRQALSLRDQGVEQAVLRKNRWVSTLFPTNALAQEAGMGLEEYEDFAFSAMGLDEEDPVGYWREKSREQERLKERLEKAREIQLAGHGTDLTLSVEGRTFVNSAGRRNMPCGEVFTGPVEDSANGHVYFGVPAAIGGREVGGVRLRFQDGKVVESSAEKGEEYLESLLDTDAGARYLGEIGIGTNYNIGRASGNVLFDEKLGGTVHLAVGRSYAETGGKNDSSVHTDLVCDLRWGGELYADRELLQRDGRFLGFGLE